MTKVFPPRSLRLSLSFFCKLVLSAWKSRLSLDRGKQREKRAVVNDECWILNDECRGREEGLKVERYESTKVGAERSEAEGGRNV